MKSIKRLVVKVGTGSLLKGRDTLQSNLFYNVAQQISKLQKDGIEVALVSSAAVAAGREELVKLEIDTSKLSKKVLAGVGAYPLLSHWTKAFAPKVAIAQVWVTYRNWCDKGERGSIKATILELLRAGIVPVTNENDVVSDEEIRLMEQGLSDNDWLAGKLAWLIEADAIIFFSDAGGVFEANPAIHTSARTYQEIDAYNLPKALRESEDKSKTGTGGIKSKILAAAKCYKKGMRVSIASLNGDSDSILRFARGEVVGTMMGRQNILK